MPLSRDNLSAQSLILNNLRRMPRRALGDFQTTMFIPEPPFYRLQQARPQAISTQATKNISIPTGKIAAIKIPAPSATAKMPMNQLFPGPRLHIRPAPSLIHAARVPPDARVPAQNTAGTFLRGAPFHCADYHSISAEAVPGAKTQREAPDSLRPALLPKIPLYYFFYSLYRLYFFPFCICHS